jgi:L-gulono-1,4-lactone dehydrogenase
MLKTADAAASHGKFATDGVQELSNFGRNLRWSSRLVRPASEAAVLELLAGTAAKTIRVISSGHSWSPIAANSDVALDLGALDSVTPVKSNGRDLVRAGAGCTLQSLLDRLHAMSDRTLPTLGVITKQTVAGAISTGTHGSGTQSLSHFVAAVRIAVFNAAGKPEIREFTDGPALLAARCGLGCVGVLLSVDFETVPKYFVAETVRRYQSVEEILAAFAKYPLTSFGFWAHEGYLSVLERRVVDRPPTGILSWLKRQWFRLSGLVFVDIGFTLLVLGGRIIGPAAIKLVQTIGPRALVLAKKGARVDDAEHVLTMRHDLFRHEEMEIFVRERDLARALRFAQAAVRFFAGDAAGFPDEFEDAIEKSSQAPTLADKKRSYVLHYPVYCRRVLAEDTLMSMATSVDEPWFSISFFTYDPPHQREPYYALCLFIAHTLRQLFEIRLHWGKHLPLRYPESAASYPRFEEFRAICMALDPNGVLRNAFTASVLNLPPGPCSS